MSEKKNSNLRSIEILGTTIIVMQFFVIIFLLQKPANENDIVLHVESLLGSTVHLASFDGNSASKREGCQNIAKIQTELYGREYRCDKRKFVEAMAKVGNARIEDMARASGSN